MATSTASPQTQSYNHLPTTLASSTHPILLRTLEPEDNVAFAAILSDPRNTEHEAGSPPDHMELSVATGAIARMRDSAAAPTVVSAPEESGPGKVLSGPGRVNLAIVYLGGDAAGSVIGLGGFGSIKDLSRATGEPVADVAAEPFERVGDVGAMVNAEYRGRGFAAEAVRLAMEWGFAPAGRGGLQLDRITATTRAANAPMVRVLAKFGWEGRAVPAQGPEGKDELTYSMRADEWEARSRK
ncbi:hypothetical protein JX266_004807 [Neoarthrinium moseri]|nr:hypothetical protein JX266_004807 [Neoarthrinium moseri]